MSHEIFRILLVEDNPADARLLQELVREAAAQDVQLTQVARLQDVDAYLERQEIDLILLDLSLPDSCGLETVVRAYRLCHQVPIVVMTGTDDQTLAVDAVKAGAEDYLVKGQVDSKTLIRTLVHARERQKVREALHESEARFRQLAENIEDVFWIYNAQDGRLLYVSPAYEAVWGRSCDGLYDDPEQRFDGVHPDDRSRVIAAFCEAPYRSEFECQYRIVRPSGEVRWVKDRIYPIHNETGRVERLAEIVTDITRDQETERALRAANRALSERNAELDQFTYVASHDLQEPVRKIVAFSELLVRDAGDSLSKAAKTDIDYISDAAHRMQTLVRDLLALCRADGMMVQLSPVALNECVDQALSALDLLVTESGASITRDPLPEVVGDVTLLTQLYQNLIGNALKFRCSDHTPTIHLTATQENGRVVLGVLDNGIGIKPEYAEKVFTAFLRLHDQRAYSGSGIGLAICRKVVERHGGRIWVESSPGKGAHFKFTLGETAKGVADGRAVPAATTA